MFLVAIYSVRHLGELPALDCKPLFCSIAQGEVVLSSHSVFLPKGLSVANLDKTLEFAPYGLDDQGQDTPLATLCVWVVLRVYLNVTRDLRSTT